MKHLPGGDLEYSVLMTLVARGSASVREIHAALGEPEGLVYTTIATVLDRLHAKRLVSRKLVGKAFVYSARVTRAGLETARAEEMLGRLLGAEPHPAMATLVDAVESIDPDLLDELARIVNARRKARHGA